MQVMRFSNNVLLRILMPTQFLDFELKQLTKTVAKQFKNNTHFYALILQIHLFEN